MQRYLGDASTDPIGGHLTRSPASPTGRCGGAFFLGQRADNVKLATASWATILAMQFGELHA